MSHGSHLKHMLYGAAAIFGVLLAAGVPAGTALTYGLLLACPLMMVWMMASGGHGGHGADPDEDANQVADKARHFGSPR